MEYEEIKKNRECFKVSENLYECPICQKRTSIKGFIQHVKNHFYERDLTNFNNAARLIGKKSHEKALEQYNNNPNKCLFCGKNILAKENDKPHQIKKKIFCDNSCSAKYNNANRDKYIYQKVKETWRKKSKDNLLKCRKSHFSKKEILQKECSFCKKEFLVRNPSQVFCSKECKEKFYGTKDDLIKWVNNFVVKNGYVPTSKMNRRMTRLARQNYGSWNNMIKELGYKPHSQKYKKGCFRCKDGHIADSISEMIVDNWLFENNIKHERRKKYPNSKKDCDFYLVDKDIWVEYFGLLNESDVYDKNVIKKEEIAKSHNLKLIGIKKEDLFPKINLQSKIPMDNKKI